MTLLIIVALRRHGAAVDPDRARAGPGLGRRPAHHRQGAGAPGDRADARADAELPADRDPVLHADRRADGERQAGPEPRQPAVDDDRPRPRRPGAGGRAVVDHLRRRLGLGGGRCVGDRLDADPLAEEARLPGAVRGRHARRGGDDRHPDPAVDPDDRLRAGLGRVDRRAVRRRHPAGPADVRGLHGASATCRAAAATSRATRRRSSGPRSGASLRTPARPS